jgi:hypothetical protein
MLFVAVVALLLSLRLVGRPRFVLLLLVMLGRVHAHALVARHRRGGVRRRGDAPPPYLRRGGRCH